MIEFSVITIFPRMFDAILNYGITKRAIQKKCIKINLWNPRNFSDYNNKKIDHKIYGGGPGMLMMFLPLFKTLKNKKKSKTSNLVIYLTPQGKKLNQSSVKYFNNQKHLIFICGRYEGIDERFIYAHVDEEWSVGDYVLTGGELPAMIFIDSITRTLPGVLNSPNSFIDESFYSGLLDCSHYTKPRKINNLSVPSVLLSGHHQNIKKWRLKNALENTRLKKPKLIIKKINKKNNNFLYI
ncbi:tRNA (guanine-N1)-methyltransferase [Buchnera aphidicola (Cinara tujafilina)]|uniref:tRNA (guanine-N(1)-)-methyltransferase n=1 Tax=Buchnera aphidicola (Cinara tujafilina) TaxID=261317 RepID=F7WZH8_9GAMM|nr:tRNA (guanosine(37)-N1)-methyltransferase TrmD [Buchnera aphidicola]AEH39842.1 tRNA (guanine-N1)-methyltransferase [Buchnera aphidicola (Cinara tujafilina)]